MASQLVLSSLHARSAERAEASAQCRHVGRTHACVPRRAGIQSPKLAQAYFGELRGAVALADAPPEEPLVAVPRAAALVVTPRAACPLPAFDAVAWKELPWATQMAALLLAERAAGRASRLWGYVQQLPSSIDTPVRWSEAELAELQYPPLQAAVAAQQQQWRDLHARLAHAWGGSGAPAWDDFLWAMENVRSRSFSGPWTGSSLRDKAALAAALLGGGGAYAAWQHLPAQQALNGLLAALMFNVVYDLVLAKKLKWHAMCPVIDAVNHSSAAESDVAFEYFKDQFVLTAKAAQSAGEQVFISYGQQSNDSLLQYYAFTEPSNPNDTYALEAKLGGRMVQVTFNARGSLTPEAATAAAAAQPDAAALQRELWAALTAEQSRPTTLADDERLLATPHLMAPRARVAAAVEKKRLLERCIAKTVRKAKKKAAAAAGPQG
eukprot:scaffold12.g7953.t1